MDDEILAIYCLCDEFLKIVGHQDDRQSQMSSAEVMTVALVAVRHFGGNFKAARGWLHQPMWIPIMLSKSRFSRRLHRLSHYFESLFEMLAAVWKANNDAQIYNVDTFPIAVCDNIRIKRCRIYTTSAYHGYKASQRRYFYGLKLHLRTTASGQPVEFMLSPGAVADVRGLRGFDFDLPAGATIIGDKAYNLYWFEEILAELGLTLLPIRRNNSKRPHESWQRGLQRLCHQSIETAGSLINQKLPNSIHATSSAGFELKVILFVLGLSIYHLLR